MVGIVDYSMGNHASVVNCLRKLEYRVFVSDKKEDLDRADILFLPGVGAFPRAMQELHDRNLVKYLQKKAYTHKPIIGICLGMQLLTDASNEHSYTKGLGLIPGEVVAMANPKWHIGWNTIEPVIDKSTLQMTEGKSFYFNHSYMYKGNSKYQLFVSKNQNILPVIIRKDNVFGLQFHPEKSQAPGRELLDHLIMEMCHA